jgi:UDP-N-acetylglucosamine enolpyruvyl transferase
VGPGALTQDEATGKIDLSTGERDGERSTARANVALVVSAVLGDGSTVGKKIDFSDGHTMISDALGTLGAQV